MLEAEHLSKVYANGTKALSDVSFAIRQGEVAMLLGHNGSGKSTLFRTFAGFESPTEGRVLMDGKPISGLTKRQMRPIRKQVGIVFQHFNLIPNLSVFQNTLFGALGSVPTVFHALNMFASAHLRDEAMECLDRVGLAHLAGQRADQLSGGQKQRVAIARMLMQKPQIILADEPIASLDPKAGTRIMELLTDIARERNLAVLCVLHHIDFALEYGDRALMLQSGRLVLDEPCGSVAASQLSGLYEQKLREEKEGA